MKADHLWIGLTLLVLFLHIYFFRVHVFGNRSFAVIPLLNVSIAGLYLVYRVYRMVQIESLLWEWVDYVLFTMESLGVLFACAYFFSPWKLNWGSWVIFVWHFLMAVLSAGLFILLTTAEKRLF